MNDQPVLFDLPEGEKPKRHKRWIGDMHVKVIKKLSEGKVYPLSKPMGWWMDDRDEGYDQTVKVDKHVRDLVAWGFFKEEGFLADGTATLTMTPACGQYLA